MGIEVWLHKGSNELAWDEAKMGFALKAAQLQQQHNQVSFNN